jgi:hypothetical protein
MAAGWNLKAGLLISIDLGHCCLLQSSTFAARFCFLLAVVGVLIPGSEL